MGWACSIAVTHDYGIVKSGVRLPPGPPILTTIEYTPPSGLGISSLALLKKSPVHLAMTEVDSRTLISELAEPDSFLLCATTFSAQRAQRYIPRMRDVEREGDFFFLVGDDD